MSNSPLDKMHQAVERARSLGDGDIGKTASIDMSAEAAFDEVPETLLQESEPAPPASRQPTVSTAAAARAEQARSVNVPDDRESTARTATPQEPAQPPTQSPAPPVQPSPRATARSRRQGTRLAELEYHSTRKATPSAKQIARNRVIAGSSGDERVEVYRQLRSQVLNRMRKHGLTNFAITSAHEDAGKTLTAVNLAIAISREVNQTVLLVDLDLNSPNVHETFGIDEGLGVIDHLRDETPLEDILLDPGYQRLLLLPGRPVPGNLSELLTSPGMKAMFADITTRYRDRIVIFDLPPLLRNDDAMSFLPMVDACLFVVEHDVTSRAQVRRSMELLADTKLLGTVLNKAL